jgi:hypothetical protein
MIMEQSPSKKLLTPRNRPMLKESVIEHISQYQVGIKKDAGSINRRIGAANLSIEQLIRNNVEMQSEKKEDTLFRLKSLERPSAFE